MRENGGIRSVNWTVDGHGNLLVKWLFPLRLRRIDWETGWAFNVGDRNSFLRAGLVHWYRGWSTLTVGRILGLRMKRHSLRYRSGRHWASSSRYNSSRWFDEWKPNNGLATGVNRTCR